MKYLQTIFVLDFYKKDHFPNKMAPNKPTFNLKYSSSGGMWYQPSFKIAWGFVEDEEQTSQLKVQTSRHLLQTKNITFGWNHWCIFLANIPQDQKIVENCQCVPIFLNYGA